MRELITHETIEQIIFSIRRQKVMLDRDLAGLYGVATKVLNQAVKRNIKRFPEDFMFKLTRPEKDELVTNCDRFKTLKHSTVTPKSIIDSYRPFPEHVVKQLKDYYRIGLTYTSNAIEGNTLTESETKVVIEEGLTK